MQASSSSIGINVAALPLAQVIPVFFFLVFFIWAVYTIVAAYHWLRYSNDTTVALSALSAHLIVSGLLAVYTVSGLVQ
jgi:hypothetical protein